jgi:hypothetical protein
MPKLKAPEGVCSFSHDGVEYEVKRGTIDVPAEAVAIALVHGFAIPSAAVKATAADTPDDAKE